VKDKVYSQSSEDIPVMTDTWDKVASESACVSPFCKARTVNRECSTFRTWFYSL